MYGEERGRVGRIVHCTNVLAREVVYRHCLLEIRDYLPLTGGAHVRSHCTHLLKGGGTRGRDSQVNASNVRIKHEYNYCTSSIRTRINWDRIAGNFRGGKKFLERNDFRK